MARLQNDLQLIAAAEKFDDLSAETWAGFEFHDESARAAFSAGRAVR